MKKRLLRTGAIAFWVVMAAWLIRYEAFPERFTHTLSGYKGLLSDDVLIEDSWMKILVGGQPGLVPGRIGLCLRLGTGVLRRHRIHKGQGRVLGRRGRVLVAQQPPAAGHGHHRHADPEPHAPALLSLLASVAHSTTSWAGLQLRSSAASCRGHSSAR
jgi:hypothetical protein